MASELSKLIDEELLKVESQPDEHQRLLTSLRIKTGSGSEAPKPPPPSAWQQLPRRKVVVGILAGMVLLAIAAIAFTRGGRASMPQFTGPTAEKLRAADPELAAELDQVVSSGDELRPSTAHHSNKPSAAAEDEAQDGQLVTEEAAQAQEDSAQEQPQEPEAQQEAKEEAEEVHTDAQHDGEHAAPAEEHNASMPQENEAAAGTEGGVSADAAGDSAKEDSPASATEAEAAPATGLGNKEVVKQLQDKQKAANAAANASAHAPLTGHHHEDSRTAAREEYKRLHPPKPKKHVAPLIDTPASHVPATAQPAEDTATSAEAATVHAPAAKHVQQPAAQAAPALADEVTAEAPAIAEVLQAEPLGTAMEPASAPEAEVAMEPLQHHEHQHEPEGEAEAEAMQPAGEPKPAAAPVGGTVHHHEVPLEADGEAAAQPPVDGSLHEEAGLEEPAAGEALEPKTEAAILAGEADSAIEHEAGSAAEAAVTDEEPSVSAVADEAAPGEGEQP